MSQHGVQDRPCPARRITALAGAALALVALGGCDALNSTGDDPGGCQSHAACADSLPCTLDRCHSDGTCSNVVSGEWCQIGGQCVAARAKNPQNPCEVCAPLASPRAWSAVPDGTTCNDGLACTFDDSCLVGSCAGTTYSCDDKLDCTIDSCTGQTPLATKGCIHDVKAGTCLIAGACLGSGARDPQNSCRRCDPARSKTAWSAAACCGDGTRDPGEQCDTADLNSMSCAKLGFAAGGLTCKGDCTFDTGGCAGGGNPTSCGNGVLDYGEACDGAQLGGMSCAKLGYASGTLGCSKACTYDVAKCAKPAGCGNKTLDAGEPCDGALLGGQTCATLGFSGGTLGCLGNCSFDYSLCSQCGNGVKEPGETCDGAVSGATCVTEAVGSGVLACDPTSCSYDYSGCGGWAVGVGDHFDGHVAVDAAGNTYVAGRFKNSVTLGGTTLAGSTTSNMFVVKLDPTGKVLWSTAGTGGVSPRDIVVSGGSVYVVGTAVGSKIKIGSVGLSTSQGDSRALVAKLSAASGLVTWAKLFGGKAKARSVAVASSGQIYVTGFFRSWISSPTISSQGGPDLFVLKLSSAGGLLAGNAYGSVQFDSGEAIALDPAGNAYVTGMFSNTIKGPHTDKLAHSSPGYMNLLVVRFSPSLKVTWAAAGRSSDHVMGTGIVYTSGGIFVGGSMDSSVLLEKQGGVVAVAPAGTGPEVLVAHVSPQGDFTWGLAAGGPGSQTLRDLVPGSDGKLYIIGGVGNAVTLGSTTLYKGSTNTFVARLDPALKVFEWAGGCGVPAATGYSLAVSPAGHIHTVGSFSPGTTFGSTTLSSGKLFIYKMPKP